MNPYALAASNAAPRAERHADGARHSPASSNAAAVASAMLATGPGYSSGWYQVLRSSAVAPQANR
jgi:hypothetical protein